jgi:nickel/cobalt transporter (NicO) family protein
MNEAVLTTIAVTGFGIAFFHAAIPTHWLPFVLTARVQQWTGAKTIGITAVAGSCHVVVTALLGLVITWLGTALSKTIEHWFPRLAGGALLLFGLYYLWRQIAGKGHVHFAYPHEHLHETPGHDPHDHHSHSHEHSPRRVSDRAAILSLLAFLTLSPCEGFLPIYVSGIRYGWTGFFLLTAILSIATVAGMVCFTSMTLAGLDRLKLGMLEKYESALMAALLCAVGLLIFFFEG